MPRSRRQKGGLCDLELIPPTVPEVRRLILAMAGPEEEREFRAQGAPGSRQALPRCQAQPSPSSSEPARRRATRARDNGSDAAPRADLPPPHQRPVGSRGGVAAAERTPW